MEPFDGSGPLDQRSMVVRCMAQKVLQPYSTNLWTQMQQLATQFQPTIYSVTMATVTFTNRRTYIPHSPRHCRNLHCSVLSVEVINYHTENFTLGSYCIQLDATATIFSLLAFVQLLFKVSVYIFGKPADINDGWIRYVWVRQWRLLNTVSVHTASQSCHQPWKWLVRHE